MFVHHVVTIVITIISYATDFNRVGAVVKALLDPGDVPLHAAKLCKYCGLNFLADRCFELFALIFFVTRLIMYAFVVKVSTFEAYLYRELGPPGWVCVVGLWILYVLQVYWFGLVLKVAYKIIVKGENAEDVRSDDENENNKKID